MKWENLQNQSFTWKNKLLTRKHVKQDDINQIFNCDLRKRENGLSVWQSSYDSPGYGVLNFVIRSFCVPLFTPTTAWIPPSPLQILLFAILSIPGPWNTSFKQLIARVSLTLLADFYNCLLPDTAHLAAPCSRLRRHGVISVVWNGQITVYKQMASGGMCRDYAGV